ncbi:WYL domain-containing protein [Sphingomonas sp. CGMCC 1.13654]|uniref:WYL domain-containing protein n=1 Tax=Sphingomonas chungangi TaxID=2683589 RepID=A0A838L738_9SPHN|nr:WYL domain-containing protein [Sphingomonas chungangi]MBA2934502.1 WYL domain-containing protein [Sphingomonas chungangi]MVW57541.1 WYL domain-containing protein [Sphingomonas chungangi]
MRPSPPLKSRHHIWMFYSSWGDAEPRWREVAPYGLLLGTHRYLVAKDIQRSDGVLRHCRVEGIFAVEILAESFEPDRGFDLCTHARAGFSSCVNLAEVETVNWRFAADAAERARRFVFHPDEFRVKNEDETVTVPSAPADCMRWAGSSFRGATRSR